MHVLVAGGTGVIGRRVVARLLREGHSVSAVARTLYAARPLYDLGARPVMADILERQRTLQMVRVRKPDVVINLAVPVPKTPHPTPTDWSDCAHVLRVGTVNLTEAAKGAGAKLFVQLSVALVHGSHGEEWTTEQTPVAKHPLTDPFLVAEETALRSGVPAVILRTGQLYAPDAWHTEQLIRQVRGGHPSIIGDGSNYWSPLHADDAAAAFVLAAQRQPRDNQVLLVADDKPVTQAEAIATLAAALEAPKPKPVSAFLGRMKVDKEWVELATVSQRVRNETVKKVLGWRPAYPSIKEGAQALAGAVPAKA